MAALLAMSLLSSGVGAQSGDVERGRALLMDRQRSLCLLCHSLGHAVDQSSSRSPGRSLGPEGANQGNLAPALADIAGRLSGDELRERIADMRRFNPDTVMPPFRSVQGLERVGAAWAGRPILSEQQLDDLVAYLGTLGAAREAPR